MRNKSEPSTESCVTQDSIGHNAKKKYCFLLFTQLVRRVKSEPDIAFRFTLKINPLCQTLPKSPEISRKTERISKEFV